MSSLRTAIRGRKIKMIHFVAIDCHQTITRHTTTSQKTVSVVRGGVVTRCDCGRMYVGDDFTLFGVANESTKTKKIKQIVALGGCQTTNSTQQPTKNKQA